MTTPNTLKLHFFHLNLFTHQIFIVRLPSARTFLSERDTMIKRQVSFLLSEGKKFRRPLNHKYIVIEVLISSFREKYM